MTILLSLNFADKNAQPQSRKKERVSHLKKYIFDTHTHIYKCHITVHRLNFVMRRKFLRTFYSNPESRPTRVECLKSLGTELKAEILMFSKRLGSSFLNCGTKV